MRLRRLFAAGLVAGCLVAAASLVHVSPPALAAPAPGVDLHELVARLLPSVVNISTVTHGKNGGPDKNFVGSGFFVDERGLILTNRHVIANADEIYGTLNDGTRLTATPLYVSPDLDLAVLKVSANKPLPVIKWGDSSAMKQGDPVIAIGNPLGLGSTVTSGIISALDRDIRSSRYDSFLQTDAAINHGNSGGPLFNLQGEVIGVNTAIYSPTEDSGSIGLNFAIPGNDAQYVLNNLKEFGRVRL